MEEKDGRAIETKELDSIRAAVSASEMDSLLDTEGEMDLSGPIDESILDLDADEMATAKADPTTSTCVEDARAMSRAGNARTATSSVDSACGSRSNGPATTSSMVDSSTDSTGDASRVDDSSARTNGLTTTSADAHDDVGPSGDASNAGDTAKHREERRSKGAGKRAREKFETTIDLSDSSSDLIELDDDRDSPVAASPALRNGRAGTNGEMAPDAKKKKQERSPIPDDPRITAREKTYPWPCLQKPSSSSHSSRASTKSSVITASDTSTRKHGEFTYEDLLDRITASCEHTSLPYQNQRKLLDVLITLINGQVQREPLAVAKMVSEQQLVLPISISIPPSQVVELLIEHEPRITLGKALSALFGDTRPPQSEVERRERQILAATVAAPAMTRVLMEIGQELVQEATYSDIVHGKNLPEMPKNLDTYKQVCHLGIAGREWYLQVAAQLKPVWESLRAKNARLHPSLHPECHLCGFKTDNLLVATRHAQMPHVDGSLYKCTMCSEFDSNVSRIQLHFMEAHGVRALLEEQPMRIQCPICPMNFVTKGRRDQHLRQCRRDFLRHLPLLDPRRDSNDVCMVNRTLWEKPPVERAMQATTSQAIVNQYAASARLTGGLRLLSAAHSNPLSSLSTKNTVLSVRGVQEHLLAQQHARMKTAGGQQHAPGTISAALSSSLMSQQQSRLQSLLAPANPLLHSMQSQLAKTGGSPQSPGFSSETLAAALKNLAAGNCNNRGGAGPAAKIPQQSMPRLGRQQPSGDGTTQAPAVAGGNGSNQTTHGAAYAALLQQQNQQRLRQQQTTTARSSAAVAPIETATPCEICDQSMPGRDRYLLHLQTFHKQMKGKSPSDMHQGAPLACSRCRDRFWTYEGLERHLVMAHGLVTSDLLAKAQRKEDGGRCKQCGKQYAFNMLQHLVTDHAMKLCSAEIMYSCDVCAFKCSSYQKLEEHLATQHPKLPAFVPAPAMANRGQAANSDAKGGGRSSTSGQQPQRRTLNGTTVSGQTVATQSPVQGGGKRQVPLFQQQPTSSSTTAGSGHNSGAYGSGAAPPAHGSRVKYTCTPCDLKFEQYAEVIAHWQSRHLKRVVVPLCRIDCCRKHREQVDRKYNASFMFPEPSEPTEDDEIITLD